MKSEPAVLIAGAGPTGLTLACGLLANGVAARVVDKAVGPAGTSRALGLQPRGIEVVERLGPGGERRLRRGRGQAARRRPVVALVADHDASGAGMLVRPDAHLGWRGRADPDALDGG